MNWTESMSVVAWDQVSDWGVRYIMKTAWELVEMTEMFIILTVVMLSWVYTYIKIHQIIYVKQVQLIMLITPQ